MPKPPLWHGRGGSKVATCCYCKSELQIRDKDASDGFTLDHFTAESAGGYKRVPCCRKCNFLKGDLSPDDWLWFIDTHPRYRREFTNPGQVVRVVREFRFAQAQARASYQAGQEARRA